ncbi:MAG TPA: DoxX family protein [Pseudonocardiaceae bacterium]|nr:DoxX family protein [Pseudonocardiaceae bacterium]
MAEVTVSGAVPAEPVAGRTATHALAEGFGGLTIAAVRIVVGFLFACHGYQKLFGAFGRAPVPVGSWPGWWAGVIELGVGSLLAIGLFTRPAAILCSGAMAYAYFTVHQAGGILPIENKGELAALYCWTFLLIAIVGPGSLALDAARHRLRSPLR